MIIPTIPKVRNNQAFRAKATAAFIEKSKRAHAIKARTPIKASIEVHPRIFFNLFYRGKEQYREER